MLSKQGYRRSHDLRERTAILTVCLATPHEDRTIERRMVA